MYERESTDITRMVIQIVMFMDLSVTIPRLSINFPECPFIFRPCGAHINHFFLVMSRIHGQVSTSAGAELRLHLVDDAKRSLVAQGQASMYKPPRDHEDAGQIQIPSSPTALSDV
jgi:hypothetical protein